MRNEDKDGVSLSEGKVLEIVEVTKRAARRR